MAGMNERELALVGLVGAQQQAAAAAQRVGLAAAIQVKLLELVWGDQDEAVLDDERMARQIADTSVRHADALLARLAGKQLGERPY